jgi:hypothetical protein
MKGIARWSAIFFPTDNCRVCHKLICQNMFVCSMVLLSSVCESSQIEISGKGVEKV